MSARPLSAFSARATRRAPASRRRRPRAAAPRGRGAASASSASYAASVAHRRPGVDDRAARPRRGSPRAARRRVGYGDPARPSFSALVRPSRIRVDRRRQLRAAAAGVRRGGAGPPARRSDPNTCSPTAAPSSTSAGIARAPRGRRGVCVKDGSIGAEGPVGLAGARSARCRRRPRPSPAANCGRSGSFSASRSLPRACSAPSSSTTR